MNNLRRVKRKPVENIKNEMTMSILEAYEKIQEQQKTKHKLSELLKIPFDIIFMCLKFILGVLAVLFIAYPFCEIFPKGVNTSDISIISISFVVAFLCGLFAYVCHKIQQEFDKETDKNFIVGYFSAIVAFVAMIMSLIGFLKG